MYITKWPLSVLFLFYFITLLWGTKHVKRKSIRIETSLQNVSANTERVKQIVNKLLCESKARYRAICILWFDWPLVRQSVQKSTGTHSANIWLMLESILVSLSEEKATNVCSIGQRLASHMHMLGLQLKCLRVRSYLKPCLV